MSAAPRVKVCGLCRPQDAALAAAAGADYVGVILAPGGPRTQSIARAGAILEQAETCSRVGVFVDETAEVVLSAARALSLDVVQLHGAESPQTTAAVREGGVGVWKALRPRTVAELREGLARFGGTVDAILIDGYSPERAGGTGTRFDWAAMAPGLDALPAGTELVVAGGLDPDNVAAAIRHLRPAVVDVSSGVEADVCEKAPERVRLFIERARGAPA